MLTEVYDLPGITCSSCVEVIESTLSSSDRPANFKYYIDLTTKTLTVYFENYQDIETITPFLMDKLAWTEIQKQKNATQISEENDTIVSKRNVLSHLKKFIQSPWTLGLIGIVSGLSLLAIMLLVGNLPFLAWVAISVLSTALTLALGGKSLYHAISVFIRTRTLTMDFLFSVSAITILIVSALSLVIPFFPMMFEAGLLIFGFHYLGKGIEQSLQNKVGIKKTFEQELPKKLKIMGEKGPVLKPIDSVQVGEIILIQPGEIIPLNGNVKNSGSRVNNRIITGSSIPISVNPQDELVSGMRLMPDSPPLYLEVTADRKHSYLARLDENIKLAGQKKAPIENAATRVLHYFIPAVIGVSVVTGIVIGCFFPPALAIQAAVTILVSACPCILGLIVPMVVKVSIQKAARQGIRFTRAAALEQAANVDTIIFDLNGTLTEGNPKVNGFTSCADEPADSLIQISALMEFQSKSAHPFAKAILEFAGPRDHFARLEIDKSHHNGLLTQINGEQWALGGPDFMSEMGVNLDPEANASQPLESRVYLSRNGKLMGYFSLTDPIRKDAYSTIQQLKKEGKKIFICTGADQKTAETYGKKLGLPAAHIFGNLQAFSEQKVSTKQRPTAKNHVIEQALKKGLNPAFVGDSENDAYACKISLGIAIQSDASSPVTRDQAGIVIDKEKSLTQIVQALAIAKHSKRNIRENLTFSLIYNIGAVLLPTILIVACGFAIHPAIGVTLMFAQMVFIMANVYRLKHKALPQCDPIELSPTLEKTKAFKPLLHRKRQEPKLQEQKEERSCFSLFKRQPKNQWTEAPSQSTSPPHFGPF